MQTFVFLQHYINGKLNFQSQNLKPIIIIHLLMSCRFKNPKALQRALQISHMMHRFCLKLVFPVFLRSHRFQLFLFSILEQCMDWIIKMTSSSSWEWVFEIGKIVKTSAWMSADSDFGSKFCQRQVKKNADHLFCGAVQCPSSLFRRDVANFNFYLTATDWNSQPQSKSKLGFCKSKSRLALANTSPLIITIHPDFDFLLSTATRNPDFDVH